jgi:hypothetical protein
MKSLPLRLEQESLVLCSLLFSHEPFILLVSSTGNTRDSSRHGKPTVEQLRTQRKRERERERGSEGEEGKKIVEQKSRSIDTRRRSEPKNKKSERTSKRSIRRKVHTHSRPDQEKKTHSSQSRQEKEEEDIPHDQEDKKRNKRRRSSSREDTKRDSPSNVHQDQGEAKTPSPNSAIISRVYLSFLSNFYFDSIVLFS